MTRSKNNIMTVRKRFASTALLALSTSSSQSFGFSLASSTFVPRPISTSVGFLGLRGGSTDTLKQTFTTTTRLSQSAVTEPDTSTQEEVASSDMSTMTPNQKLEALRSKMKELDLDVYLVPSGDPHLSGTCGLWIAAGLHLTVAMLYYL